MEGDELQKESTRRISAPITLRLNDADSNNQEEGGRTSTNIIDTVNNQIQPPPLLTRKRSSIQVVLDTLEETPSIAIWPRVLLLFLCVFLFGVSFVYCIAQTLEVTLKVLADCPDTKTPQEIWEHSYQLSLQENGEAILDERYHYGRHGISCYSPHRIQVNKDDLWYSNQYDWNWTSNINYCFILFGMISLCLAMVVLYGVITLIADLKAICNGTIHQKSREYSKYLQSMKMSSLSSVTSTPSPTSTTTNYIKKCRSFLSLLHYDTATWMGLRVMGECTEFLLQSAAFLRYGGYDLFDAGDTPLAEKPGAIIAFASALCFNCIGSGIMWLSYALFPRHCFGVVYSRCLFWIDKLSDLLYALFPIYVILSDDYNSDTDISDIMVLFGLLNQDGIQFVATFFPLCMLTHRCIIMAVQTTSKMRNQYFNKWQIESSRRVSQRLYSDSVSSSTPRDELDANNVRALNQSWILQQSNMLSRGGKRIIVVFIAAIFLLFGVFMITAAVYHVNTTEEHCHSVTETSFISNGSITYPSEIQQQTLATNPELFAYDQCLYKVYPFTDDEIYRCQCRVFYIRWESDFESTSIDREEYLNLTQPVMMDGMMRHWFMMEKLMTSEIDERVQYNLSWNAMRDTVHIKAIEWKRVPTTNLLPDHFDHWKDLEFLSIIDTLSFAPLPESFGRLEKLRYLEMDSSGIDNHFPIICNLTNLEVIWFYIEVHIYELPECMNRLVNMRLIAIEISGFVDSFPLSLLSLPQLSGFSLSRNDISWDGLLDGNMPPDIDRNDTDAVMEWLDEHFIFSNDTEYFLSLNPICYENVSFLSPRITDFISTACEYPVNTSDLGAFSSICGRWFLGDGQCQVQCNDESLLFDMGDCIQLCFAEEISNCTLDKLANDRCDPGCDNRYCTAYDALSIITRDMELNEDTMLIIQDDNGILYAPDRFQCPWNWTVSESEEYPLCSASSTESMFIDSNIPNATSIECDPSWIGDTMCDDSCRVSDCGFDKGDCNAGCTDEVCSIMNTVWVYFTADQHILNFTYGCEVMYPTVLTFFDLLDVVNCSEQIRSLDYNQDGMMNFREFVVFGVMAINDFDPESSAKASNVNCSSCGDSEYYNLYAGY